MRDLELADLFSRGAIEKALLVVQTANLLTLGQMQVSHK